MCWIGESAKLETFVNSSCITAKMLYNYNSSMATSLSGVKEPCITLIQIQK